MGEHDRADLAGADGAFQVEFHCQRLTGKFAMRDMRQHASGINIDGMTAGRLDGGDAGLVDALRQVGGLAEAIGQIGFIQTFVQTDRHRIQVAARQAAVGVESLPAGSVRS